MSMGEAAKHFGISKGTIGYWASQRRAGKYAAEPVKLTIAPAPPQPSRVANSGTFPRAAASAQTSAANLSDDVRDGLRDTVRNTVEFLRGGPLGEAKAFANAANGLRHILTSIPDLMKIEASTATTTEAAASAPPTATDVAGEIAKRRRQQSTG